ncbi:MAG: transposase [Planctomycetia bacterium]|nr:transposase [Planctomycetia bacterium]
MPEPIYTTSNCRPAYQLRWSLALFAAADIPPPGAWLAPVQIAVETDGVRILDFHFQPPNVQLFLVSTQPPTAPPEIVKSVKGRLQHEISAHVPRAFQRNFSLTSVGGAKREAVEAYVADQLGNHRMADDRVQERLQEFQLSFPVEAG